MKEGYITEHFDIKQLTKYAGQLWQYMSRDIKAKKIVYNAFDPSSVRRKSTKALKLGSFRKKSKKGKVRKSTKSKASRAY